MDAKATDKMRLFVGKTNRNKPSEQFLATQMKRQMSLREARGKTIELLLKGKDQKLGTFNKLFNQRSANLDASPFDAQPTALSRVLSAYEGYTKKAQKLAA